MRRENGACLTRVYLSRIREKEKWSKLAALSEKMGIIMKENNAILRLECGFSGRRRSYFNDINFSSGPGI
jgi:hypothetical protein